MEVVEAQSESVIYVGGIKCDTHKHAWYRVDLEFLKRMTTKVQEDHEAGNDHVLVVKRRRKKKKVLCYSSMRDRPLSRWVSVKRIEQKSRIKLATAAQIKDRIIGSPIVIGDDLYWYGLTQKGSMDLLQTDVSDNAARPFSWKTVSSTRGGAVSHVTVFPIAGKLYALCGADNTKELNLCGQIYDLGSGTWEYLKRNISTRFRSEFYLTPHVALSENKTEFVFYSMLDGSVLYFDVASRELLRKEDDHDALVLWGTEFVFPVPPRGLENCGDLTDLVNATLRDPARLRNNILYWITPNLYLFGYDLNLRRWFLSSSLCEQFPWGPCICYGPFLLDLPNGKLLAVVPEGPGDITVAPLTVSLDADSLIVTVESFYPFSVDADDFIPFSELSE